MSLLPGVSSGNVSVSTKANIKNVGGNVDLTQTNQYFKAGRNAVLSYAPINSVTNMTTYTPSTLSDTGSGGGGGGYVQPVVSSGGGVDALLQNKTALLIFAVIVIVGYFMLKRKG